MVKIGKKYQKKIIRSKLEITYKKFKKINK